MKKLNGNQYFLFDYSKEKKIEQKDLIKERATTYGTDTLLNFEALSLLTGIKLDKLKDFSTLAELREFMPRLKLTQVQTLKLEAFFELAIRFNKEQRHNQQKRIVSPKSVVNLFMAEMKHLKKEEFRVVLLNTKNYIIKTVTISIGSLAATVVHPREVFKEAIINSASSIILCHNHPSGDPYPSFEDKEITKTLVKAGRLVGIPVTEHIIIGYDRFFSFKEKELMD